MQCCNQGDGGRCTNPTGDTPSQYTLQTKKKGVLKEIARFTTAAFEISKKIQPLPLNFVWPYCAIIDAQLCHSYRRLSPSSLFLAAVLRL